MLFRSVVTGIYNTIMEKKLPEHGISCIIVPRKAFNSGIISASTVRQAIKDGDWDLLSQLVPQTTLDFFQSREAEPIIKKIRKEANVIHY